MCQSFIQRGGCQRIQVKYKYAGKSLPHFQKQSTVCTLSFGLSNHETIHQRIVRGFYFCLYYSWHKGRHLHLLICLRKCWTATTEMPIAPNCICIRRLLFQICVSNLFKGPFKVDWFPKWVQCVSSNIRLFCIGVAYCLLDLLIA